MVDNRKFLVYNIYYNKMKRVENMLTNLTTRDLVFIALFAALTAVCAWISIPASISFTLQTFAVFFTLAFLGGKRGLICITVYILLGAVGVPVFSGVRGGIGVLLGNTGGYIVGFIFIAVIYIILTKLFGIKTIVIVFAMLLGLITLYTFGTAWFMIVYTNNTGEIALWKALNLCVIPFIVPDLIKLSIALTLAKRLKKTLIIEQ